MSTMLIVLSDSLINFLGDKLIRQRQIVYSVLFP